jgi:putative endonuclease
VPGQRRGKPGDGDSDARRALGAGGEKLAGKFLRKLGCKILATNYRCPSGEIDLIVLDSATAKTIGAQTVVFVEVKTRTSGKFAAPQAAVNAAKQRQIKAAAGYYLRTHDTQGLSTRFDIVAVVQPEGREPTIEHIPSAFA